MLRTVEVANDVGKGVYVSVVVAGAEASFEEIGDEATHWVGIGIGVSGWGWCEGIGGMMMIRHVMLCFTKMDSMRFSERISLSLCGCETKWQDFKVCEIFLVVVVDVPVVLVACVRVCNVTLFFFRDWDLGVTGNSRVRSWGRKCYVRLA